MQLGKIFIRGQEGVQVLKKTWVRIIGIVALVFGATVAVAVGLNVEDSDTLGAYLVDEEGLSVYVYLPDEAGSPTCVEGCATYWLGLEGDEPTLADDSLDQALLGTVDNPEGFTQITYAGWPLYQFAHDRNPGDTRGQGSTGEWFLISPEGNPLQPDEDVEDEEEEDAAESSEADAGEDAEAEMSPEVAALMGEGEKVFQRVCAACHGDSGQGGAGVNLVGNPRLADAEHITDAVLNGLVYMPAQRDNMTTEESHAVLTFVRNAWGNDFGSVSLEIVQEVMGE